MATHPASIWLDANWATLPAGVWVSASRQGLVSEGPDYPTLMQSTSARLIALNLAWSEIAVVYVPTAREVWQ